MTDAKAGANVLGVPIDPALSAAQAGDRRAFESVIAPHLAGLKAHCYRMSGSWHAAEDLLQDSLTRAWKGLPSFQGRSSLKTWLYQVTTRACLDALAKEPARTLPTNVTPPTPANVPPSEPHPDLPWLEPFPGEPTDEALSPEKLIDTRQSVAFAFLTLVQKLPPRQRAVLLLRDVLGCPAAECAELLETSVASVNSALQRAREEVGRPATPAPKFKSDSERQLVEKYVHAWQHADVDELLSLLVEGATLAMPPFSEWYQGHDAIGHQLRTMAMPPQSKGMRRFRLTTANALPAMACWRMEPDGSGFSAEALHVLELEQGRIKAITAFITPHVFAAFGLPVKLPADAATG